jgi:hypothetical protein
VLHKLPLTEPKEESEPNFTEARWPSGTRRHRLQSLPKANLASGAAARDHLCSKTAFVWGRSL